MFGLSLAIGWWVAGRALRPVEAITTTTREITATDLSRRIARPAGRADELRTLADTIDGMLDRLDDRLPGRAGPGRGRVPRAAQPGRGDLRPTSRPCWATSSPRPTSGATPTAVVTRATGRMSRLLDDLLATARKRSAAFVDREVDLAGRGPRRGRRVHAAGGRASAAARAPAGRRDRSSTPTRRSLDRALSNLLSNAVRLAPAGSVVTVAGGQPAGLGLGRRPRPGPGHPRRGTRPGLRPLPPGTGVSRASGSGPGPGHRPADRREPRGPAGPGRPHRPGQHLRGLAARTGHRRRAGPDPYAARGRPARTSEMTLFDVVRG